MQMRMGSVGGRLRGEQMPGTGFAVSGVIPLASQKWVLPSEANSAQGRLRHAGAG